MRACGRGPLHCASSEEGTTCGNTAAGTRSSASMAGSHSPVRRFSRSVRLALLASVTWCLPPVRFHTSQLSMVPKASSPRSARSRAPGTWSRIHASLVPEKYGSSRRPVAAVTAGSWPAATKALQVSAVRRSCQTMAWWMGSPVRRSHTTVVSRWLVMPTAANCCGVTPALASTSVMVAACVAQSSCASCSTQPEAGKCWVNSRCATATMPPWWSNRMERELVVPWSRARMNWLMTPHHTARSGRMALPVEGEPRLQLARRAGQDAAREVGNVFAAQQVLRRHMDLHFALQQFLIGRQIHYRVAG